MSTHMLSVAAVLSLALLAGPPAHGDDAGITVTGSGEVKAKPNLVEFEVRAAGAGELTGDAIVKYRDAKRRLLEAFDKLKLKNLDMDEQAVSLTSAGGATGAPIAAVFPGGNAAPVKAQIEIARTIRLSLRGIQDSDEQQLMETIGKIVDTARDAGASIGPAAPNDFSAVIMRMYGQQAAGAMCTFVLENPDELRQRALADAMVQARTRAGQLAGLAGVKLGQVISVEEATAPAATDETNIQAQIMMAAYGVSRSGGKADSRLTSDKFAEIPVQVTLRVRFAIEK